MAFAKTINYLTQGEKMKKNMTQKITTIKVKVKLLDQLLGTKASNPSVFDDYIASKCDKEDRRRQELKNAQHIEECSATVFHKTADGKPFIYDYQIKGFFKEMGRIIRASGDEFAEKVGSKKKWGVIDSKIDNYIFIAPREIIVADSVEDGYVERPLRGKTMMGERIALARSESVAAGSEFEFEVTIMPGPVTIGMVQQILDYGRYKGLGQWRNSGKGRIEYEIIS